MTALSESFYLMSIHNVFSWPISTFLLFSRIGKPVLDKSLIIDMLVPPGATARIVAKRATGTRFAGNQREKKKVKPPNDGNPRTMPNKPKTNQTIMILHSPA